MLSNGLCCVFRLEDVGLEKFSVPVLFTKIFIPAAFLLVLGTFLQNAGPTLLRPSLTAVFVSRQVCIIHLHYFHEPFLQLTDLKTVVETHNSTITR